MECASRISYATWRLGVFRILERPCSPAIRTSARYVSTSPLRSQHHDALPDEISQRERPSQQLPQSPLLSHPRNRANKTRKRRPTAADDEELQKNPWAVALASPSRQCSLTGARIPRDLLGEWGMVKRPDADQVYLLPLDLLQDSLRSPKPPTPEDSSTGESSTQTKNREDQIGRRLFIRILNYLPLLQRISEPLSRKTRSKKTPIMRLLPFRWKHPQGPVTAHEERKIVWRENMPQFVLQSMRKQVVRELVDAYSQPGHLDGTSVWTVLDVPESSEAGVTAALGRLEPFERMECGGVLLLGSPSPDTVESSLAVPDSVTLPQTQSTVPVFDLSVLLSDVDLGRLRESLHFQHPALFFRPASHATVKTMLSLWRLKRYLGDETHS